MPELQKTQSDQTNLKENELQKALQDLQAQTKQLQEQNQVLLTKLSTQEQEKVEAVKKAAEEKKKKELENLEHDIDLEALLRDTGESSGEPSGEKKKTVDQLSNEEILDVVSGAVEKFVEAKLKMDKEEREKTQDGFLKKLSNVEGMLGHIVATQTVQDLAGKYPDFADYRADVIKLVQENPTLSLERAYKLAKAEKMDKEPATETVETELPDIGPSGLPLVKRRTNADGSNRNIAGLSGFRSLLDAGAARVIAGRTKR